MKKLLFASLFFLTALIVNAALPKYLVTAPNPSKFELEAEKELQFFWQQLYGTKLEKISAAAAKGKAAIYLGQTDFAKANGADFSKCDREEWILKSVGDSLIISGGRPVGSLYGVYEMLERVGISFLAPDETYVPSNKPALPKFNEKRKPDFNGRLVYDGIPTLMYRTKATQKPRDMYTLWLLRIRQNGQAIHHIPSRYIGSAFNITTFPNYHSLSNYVNPNLFEKHPEYFQMDAMGRRRKPRGWEYDGSLCMSNKDVRRITLESLRKMIIRDRKKFDKDNWPTIYDISTLDASPYICYCPECKKISAYDGSETGLLLDYINEVAREIRKEYPEIIIRTFGYSPSKKAPTKIMPEKNVLIQLTDSFSTSNPFHPLESKVNKAQKEYFNTWIKTGANLMVWDYLNLGGTYFNPPRIETVFNALQPDFKFFHKNNIRSVFLECSLDGIRPQNFMQLNYHTASRLLVDRNADIEKIADTYLRGYYGPAYEVMAKYFKLIREGIAKDFQFATSMSVGQWKYANSQFMFNMYTDLTKAANALPKDSKYAKRVQYELLVPLWSIIINWDSCEPYFAKSKITKKQLIDELTRYTRNFARRYECRNPQYVDKAFESMILPLKLNVQRPEKFKNVPAKNFKMVTYRDFTPVGNLNSYVAKDPESIHGFALKSANKRPEAHGVNIMIDKRNRFYSTQFVLGNHRASGRVETVLRQVPTDEKYHWYRIPGKIELKSNSYFWGHSWAIQARTAHWYFLTDGNPLDNTWDQVWFHAKFTGPAYVPGSTKDNAVYVDMAVIVRGEKDEQFIKANVNAEFAGKTKNNMPKNWFIASIHKNTGTASVIEKDGKNILQIKTSPKNITDIRRPDSVVCGNNAVVRMQMKVKGEPNIYACIYLYSKNQFLGTRQVRIPASGYVEEAIFDIGRLHKDAIRFVPCIRVDSSSEGKTVEIEDFDVSYAPDFNIHKTQNK
ncbi:MAG: DUF4838 domain-containing protein [Lentisphaeria bacterium]|nr:DUF4838 domain-containing protein [Lentisphaeria bacterium]